MYRLADLPEGWTEVVEAQAFEVGPVEGIAALAGHHYRNDYHND